jgi:hypothetical protein
MPAHCLSTPPPTTDSVGGGSSRLANNVYYRSGLICSHLEELRGGSGLVTGGVDQISRWTRRMGRRHYQRHLLDRRPTDNQLARRQRGT